MREKLYDYLRQRADGATPEELLQLIFAPSTGDRAVGNRVLETMLGSDQRFILKEPAGRWYLRNVSSVTDDLGDTCFVVVDLETTSLGTSAHNIIEFAAARVHRGKVLDEFSQLVNPGRSLPPFIVQLTGITDAMLADQPNLFDVWPSFRDFLGSDVIVAHNASFDLGFLNAVSTLHDGKPLANRVLCTLKLARRLLSHLPRRGLDALAAHFGIPQDHRHRALGDVRITVEVLFQLIEILKKRGIDKLDAAEDFQQQARDGRRFESFLPREKVLQLPPEPGIYRLYDDAGQLLYIGRAKNLRDRVQSYLSNANRHSDKTLDLIRHAHDVRVEVLGSELEAALDEAEAIRREKPPYNRLAKHLPRVAFIKLTEGDAFPRLAITTKLRRGRSRYFGPFRSRNEAEQVIALLARLFQLRTCAPPLKPSPSFEPCVEGRSGSCSAPCAMTVSPEQYRGQAQACLELLEGDATSAEPILAAKRDAHSVALRFESAAHVQREIELLRTVAQRQRRRNWITRNPNLLILQRSRHGSVLAYVVLEGVLVVRDQLHDANDIDQLIRRVAAFDTRDEGAAAVAHMGVDGMTIVAAWMRDRGERDGFVFELQRTDVVAIRNAERPATLDEWRAACASLLSPSTL